MKNFFKATKRLVRKGVLLTLIAAIGYSYINYQLNHNLSQTEITEILHEVAEEKNVDYKMLYSICKHESGLKPYALNVNKSTFNIQKGSHFFDNPFLANLYMDFILEPLNLNYDIGMCQINSQHLNEKLSNSDLLNPKKNIEMAAKIYYANLQRTNGNIIEALSMYNTGKAYSKTGERYAQMVLKHINDVPEYKNKSFIFLTKEILEQLVVNTQEVVENHLFFDSKDI